MKFKLLGLFTLFASFAFAQDLPQPSPAASVTQRIGVTDVTVTYSRPAVKGRQIFGELVPFNEIWRVGANASTKIEFSTDVMIEGNEVPAGKYAIFMIPRENGYDVIISSFITGWGTTGYTEESDVARFTIDSGEGERQESMMFYFDKLSDNSGMLFLKWDRRIAAFEISTNTVKYGTELVNASIKEADDAFRIYNKAAGWYMNTANDNAKALEMAQKSVDLDKRFWNLTVLSEAHAANGDKKTAIKVAKEALEMSVEADYQPYVDRNTENIKMWEAK